MSEQTLPHLTVNLAEAKTNIIRCIKAGLVPFLQGPPAAGKSAVIRQIAEEYNLKLIDLRLSQCDPCDLQGFPRIDEKTGKASYAPMDTFPLEGDEIPKGYSGWLLFFDELNSAPRSVQAATYKPLHEKEVGQRKIHPNVAMAAAGNGESDNAVVEPLSTAIESRLIHMEVVVNHEVWLEWAMRNGIDHRITAFIQFKPNLLHMFDPDHTDKTFPAPRTWEYASKLIKGVDKLDGSFLPLLAGTIGQGTAREFIEHTKIYHRLPTIKSIMTEPRNTHVPDEPSVLFALTGSIANHATKDNITHLLPYVQRISKEFQVVCLREVVRRVPGIEETAPMQEWIVDNAAELF